MLIVEEEGSGDTTDRGLESGTGLGERVDPGCIELEAGLMGTVVGLEVWSDSSSSYTT